MITVELIKQIYPHPTVVPKDNDGLVNGYCVGGAVCMMANVAIPFPATDELADVLRTLNTNLTPLVARRYATKIILKNDLGAFPSAWKVVAEALTYL